MERVKMAGNTRNLTIYMIGTLSFLILNLVHNSEAFPTGAITSACNDLTPQHGANPQTSNSPYTISVTPAFYTVGQQMTVTISTSENSPALKGILLQARRAASSTNSNQIIGTWSLGSTSDYQYLACNGANSAVTHTNNNDKPETIQFSWIPPDVNGDDIFFTATFVQSRFIFWVGETTGDIQEETCSSEPCNNGTCESVPNGIRCNCLNGYTGIVCDVPPVTDPCDSNPCLSGGSCTSNGNSYACNCPASTTGPRCEMPLSPCDSSPCLNGGTCANSGDDTTFTCTCPFNYTGLTCQTGIDPCANHLCENGATCIQVPSSINYTCECVSGFSGERCETENLCDGNFCQNGGVCIPVSASATPQYSCQCTSGFSGFFCQTASTISNPCDTANPCLNGGVCLPMENNQFCICLSLWTGTYCESPAADFCIFEPCLNDGICISSTNSHNCICRVGWIGEFCQTALSEACENMMPCLNGGTCRNEGLDGYSCECVEGWTGTNCEVDVNECLESGICGQGDCYNTDGSYECTCFKQWTGDNCDTQLHICTTDPCQNGGLCLDHETNLTSYTCTCTSGWSGEQCETDIDECEEAPSTCGDHGVCKNTEGSFHCDYHIIIIAASSGGSILVITVISRCACIWARKSSRKRGNKQKDDERLEQSRQPDMGNENDAFEIDNQMPTEAPPACPTNKPVESTDNPLYVELLDMPENEIETQ